MVNYDPAVVQNFADSLYREASNIVGRYVIRRVAVGLAIGSAADGLVAAAVAAAFYFKFTPLSADIAPAAYLALAGVCALIGGITGYFAGKEKGLQYA